MSIAPGRNACGSKDKVLNRTSLALLSDTPFISFQSRTVKSGMGATHSLGLSKAVTDINFLRVLEANA